MYQNLDFTLSKDWKYTLINCLKSSICVLSQILHPIVNDVWIIEQTKMTEKNLTGYLCSAHSLINQKTTVIWSVTTLHNDIVIQQQKFVIPNFKVVYLFKRKIKLEILLLKIIGISIVLVESLIKLRKYLASSTR